MSKEHSAINCRKEFEPDVLNTFCATWVLKPKLLQRMYEFISALATQTFNRF